MAYTSPPTKSPGDLLQSADWNTYVRDNFSNHEGRILDFSGGRWTKTTNQSVADNTATLVTFPDSEVYDLGGWGLTATNTKITVPAGAIPAGATTIVVSIGTTISFAADADGRRIISLLKNGVEIDGRYWVPAENLTIVNGLSTEINAVAGDYFEVNCLHTAGSNLNVSGMSFWISRKDVVG